MPNTTISPNMNLPIPVVSVDPGPDWANNINACLNAIDSHNHTTGQGVQITPAGININTDLDFNGNNGTVFRSVRFNPQGSPLALASDLGCLYEVDVDLYYNDGNGNQVRITQSGSVTGSAGTITGLPSGTASASYSGGTFTFQQATNTPATMNVGSVIIGQEVASGYGVTLQAAVAQAANYSLTLPAVAPTANQVPVADGSGNLTWTRGLLPLGSIIATFPNLSGAYTTANTTTADANGFVLCGGQTIADATSPMNGAVVPNINNSVFLMGSSTAGSTGGSNTTTLTTTQLPAHTHGAGSFATSVGVTGGTASLTGTTTFATSTHTHPFDHSHQWGYVSSAAIYGFASIGTAYLDGSFTNATSGTAKIMDTVPVNAVGGGFYSPLFTNLGSTYFTSGPTVDGTNLLTSTDGASASASVGISSTGASITGSNSVTGTSASSGTGSSYDSRPNYISAVYLMRIK